ncbi:MAG: hypothetical protein GY847_25685 [Proteobacteria bacterium]|nr:hypothetical protein [Pseudomonadota bacterium]
MKVLKVIVVCSGAGIMFAAMAVENIIADVLIYVVGVVIICGGLQIPIARKHVVQYYRRWDQNAKRGIDPVNPLSDAPDEYIKIVPEERKRIARVIHVQLKSGQNAKPSESLIEEIPL